MSTYRGILAGGWLSFFAMIFTIAAIGAIVWFVFYNEVSREKTRKNTIIGIILTSTVVGLAIQLYLAKNGIPENVIIEDKNGNNTYQTVKNLKDISKDTNIKSVIAVSQYYHLLRARLAFNKFGFDSVYLSYAKN